MPTASEPAAAAADRWRRELAGWAVPAEILAGAPESPWGFPVEFLRFSGQSGADSPSRRRALELLPVGGSVLDVGCGGGQGALSLVPPAGLVIGVDEAAEQLGEFAAAADRIGVAHQEVPGRWPDVAAAVPEADVVVCHHVAYNVPELAGFARALTGHARRRVVLELTERHPRADRCPLATLPRPGPADRAG